MPAHAAELEKKLKQEGIDTQVLYGAQALIDVASADEVSGVMCAIVGAAGLPSAFGRRSKGQNHLSGQQRNAGGFRRIVHGNRPSKRRYRLAD